MKTYLGNTSTEFNIKNDVAVDCITRYIITNVSAASIQLNVFIGNHRTSEFYRIAPKNLTLAIGETFSDENVCLIKDGILRATTNGSVDYYVAMEPHANH